MNTTIKKHMRFLHRIST